MVAMGVVVDVDAIVFTILPIHGIRFVNPVSHNNPLSITKKAQTTKPNPTIQNQTGFFFDSNLDNCDDNCH
jgi:hypothetical protein